MNANKIVFFLLSLVALLVLGVFPIPEASAQNLSQYSFGGEWINDWSSCACNQSRLYYCDDKIEQLDSVLFDGGLMRAFRLSQSNVKADHVIEDYNFNGYDRYYADNVTLYAFCGHGNTFTNSSGQPYHVASYCSRGSSNYTPINGNNSCLSESHQMRFGESSSIPNYGTNYGHLQWLIYSTCYSIESSTTWRLPLTYGGDMVMGYKGLSTNAESTDENLADFAEDAVVGTSAFKQAWFYANEDWYADDNAAITTCTSSNSNNTATYRLNNYKRTWTPRKNNGSAMTCSYSYHAG